jgi:hypothetical protein
MRALAAFVAGVTLSACVVGEVEDDADDEALSIAAGNSPDNMIRVANVNLYKGAFGENDGIKTTDGRNFLYYLAQQQYVPDIFTVQNLDHDGKGFHSCGEVANKLEKYLEPRSVTYAFFNPSERGGACVIYRAGRFERLGAVEDLGAWGGTDCNRKGIESVGVRLRDKKKGKTIAVVSVHMPGERECTRKNTQEFREWVDGTGADIKIISGDFNTNTNDSFASIGVMKTVLENDGFRTADLWGPLDWIWRKGEKKTVSEKRVEYAEASGAGYPSAFPYSDHRGGFVDLKY